MCYKRHNARKSLEEGVSPQISIVIPTRSRARQLGALLDSLAAQCGAEELNWETILVDDAGGESARSAIEQYLKTWKASPVRLHVLETRGGVSRARNTGVQLSRGDVIAFLDDDILVDRGFLAETARAHAAHPEILIINGKLQKAREDYYSQIWHYHYSAAFDRALDSPYRVNRVASGFCSVKRGLLERVPVLFDESLPSREDFDLLLRLREEGIAVFKHDNIIGYHDFRTSLPSLLRQRLWYQEGQRAVGRKYGEAALRAFDQSEDPVRRPWKFFPLYASIRLTGYANGIWRNLWSR
jgi:glycosyltransferase involved in cell wall biosynthesis